MIAIGNMMIKFQLLEPIEHARYLLHCNPSAEEGGRTGQAGPWCLLACDPT